MSHLTIKKPKCANCKKRNGTRQGINGNEDERLFCNRCASTLSALSFCPGCKLYFDPESMVFWRADGVNRCERCSQSKAGMSELHISYWEIQRLAKEFASK